MTPCILLALLFLPVIVTATFCEQNVDPDKCHCSFDDDLDYEIVCPFINSKFSVALNEGRFAKLTCNSDTTYLDLVEYLEGLELGPLTHLSILGCPVPEEDLGTFITQRVGATGLTQLAFTYATGALQPFHFKNLGQLKLLDLTTSLVKANLERGFFQGLENLLVLKLGSNRGLQIHPSTFQNLTSLRELHLADCDIPSFHEDQFRNLTLLSKLIINSNQLGELQPGLFQDLGNLKVLDFHSNRLTGLPSGILQPLTSLTDINLGHNAFESLPEDLFRNNLNLTNVLFILNWVCKFGGESCSSPNVERKLRLPATLFQSPSIKSIKMLHVPVHNFSVDIFKGCTNLENLTVQSGQFDSLPERIFRDAVNLVNLDFSANGIRHLSDNLFAGLSKLKSLRLLRNRLTEIQKNVFRDLLNLENLTLSRNLISKIDKDSLFFLKNLVDLDLSHNSLVYSGTPRSWFLNSQAFARLVNLNLSNNSFSAIEENVVVAFNRMENLDISYNSFTQFRIEDFNFIRSNTKLRIDLSHNKIRQVRLEDTPLTSVVFRDRDSLPFDLNLSGNPLDCDCHITELKQKLEGQLNSSLNKVFNIVSSKALRCGSNSIPKLQNKSLRSVSYDDLNCHFPSDLDPTRCPARCGCARNRFHDRITVNCSRQAAALFPDFLPRINGSKIRLVLENNKIDNLSVAVAHLREKREFSEIAELYLTNNQLTDINYHNLPKELTVLHIDGNRLEEIMETDLGWLDDRMNHSELTVRMGRNPYDCSCRSKDLHRFMREHNKRIEDKYDVSLNCEGPRKPLLRTNIAEFCTENFLSPFIIVLIVIVLILLVSVIVLLFIYSCFKDTLLIWLYSKSCLRFLFTDDLIDSDKPFDAFISYSHHDADFVNEVLIPGLENPEDFSHKYRCLTHEKDWLVGQPIPENIINSVKSSRRTIIVLSKEFIKSMWSTMEFRAAHAQALQDKTQRVVIVVRGELPPEEEMEEDLKKYISMNTYIHSENPWFWQRLRYALPHRGSGFWNHKRRRHRKNTDQLELMTSQAEAELKGGRTPSPPTISASVDEFRVGSDFTAASSVPPTSNGKSMSNGGFRPDAAVDELSAVGAGLHFHRNEKDLLTEQYLRRVVPNQTTEGGKMVRDILVGAR